MLHLLIIFDAVKPINISLPPANIWMIEAPIGSSDIASFYD